MGLEIVVEEGFPAIPDAVVEMGFVCRKSKAMPPDGFSGKKFISRWMHGRIMERKAEAKIKARLNRKLLSLLSKSLKKR